MNSLLRCCILAASVVVLAACASQGSTGYAAPPVASAPGEYAPDGEYMAAVDYVARRRGVQVHWINPPLKLAVNDAVDDNGLD